MRLSKGIIIASVLLSVTACQSVREGVLPVGLVHTDQSDQLAKSTASTGIIPSINASCTDVKSESTVLAVLDQTFQSIDGFGTSVRLFNDPHVTETFDPLTKRAAVVVPQREQVAILKRLYEDIGLTFIRPATGGKVEPINDNSDPAVTDPSKFDFGFTGGDDYIEYVRRAQAFGSVKHFLSPIVLEKWMNEGSVEEYAEWAIANIVHWKNQGLEPPYYSIMNEPSYQRGGIWSPQFVRAAVKEVGRRLDALGLSTKLVVPDDVRSSDAARIARVVLADPEARQYIGAIATHLYDEPVSNIAELTALSKRYDKPLWMTEFSIFALPTAGVREGSFLSWAELMHDLLSRYGVSNIMYMWGFIGQWDGYDTSLITINNSGTKYLGFKVNKHYYAMGQYSKFVRPGSKRVQVDYPKGNSLKVSAYSEKETTAVVVVNLGDETVVSFRLKGKNIASVNQATSTSVSTNSVEVAHLCIDRKEVVYSIPANSVTTVIVNQ